VIKLDFNRFDQIVEQYNNLRKYKDHLEISIAKDSKKLEGLQTDYDNSLKARAVIQSVAEETQKKIEHRVSDLVSMALEAVFPDPYKFVLEFKTARNKTECDVWFEKHGERVHPFDASGGGVIDIASLASRIAFFSLSPTNPIFAFDEPTRNVSYHYRELVAELLRLLSDDFDLQFLITTHIQEIVDVSDRRVEL
jgi:DNA repair exonuclease SbcCD ATPase subunit